MPDRPLFTDWRTALIQRETSGQQKTQPPEKLSFSAKSLEDYLTCRRRFQLTYIERIQWPGVLSEPLDHYEQHVRAGQDFHRLVQRHLSGLDKALLQPNDPLLRRWWQAYLMSPPANLPPMRKPEIQASALLVSHRLTARFDLLAYEIGGRAVIVDWKTSFKSGRQHLSKRMQTRIYPFILYASSQSITGSAVEADQISLIYWFAEEPDKPETFPYNDVQAEADHLYLTTLIDEIDARDTKSSWELTDDLKACAHCTYRSLCDRGIKAGFIEEDEVDDNDDLFIDFDSLDEIAF